MSKFGATRRRPEKLNITSLMDALTIILIFLLVNYSSVTEEHDLPAGVELPEVLGNIDSKSEVGVLVAVGKKQISLGNSEKTRKVINFEDFESEKDRVLTDYADLLKEFKANRELASENILAEGDELKKKIKISIQADKQIAYRVIDSLMQASAGVGMNFVDFVTKKKQE